MKRAQMELMGIAIVVVLLSLVMLFVVRFIILDDRTDVSKEYGESEQAANFLNTMLKTSALECSGVKFSTLFQDCAKTYPDGEINCGNQLSCDYLNTKVSQLFLDTFEVWKVDYYFMAYNDPDDPENTLFEDLSFGEPCTGNRRVKIQPLPIPPDNMYLALFICD